MPSLLRKRPLDRAMNFLDRWFVPSASRKPGHKTSVLSRSARGLSYRLRPAVSSEQSQVGLHFGGLKLADLLECHSAWVQSLARDLDAKHEGLTIPLASIAQHHTCALGRWLHSDIRERFGHSPEYQALYRHHGEFHRLAADICRCHNQGLHDVARWGLMRDLRVRSEQLGQDLERFFASHPL